ncbi:hypothetical protein C8Q74DRAFT_1213976 [Fomes fomentarius]|nr:hypothetical protein C8Q74DRAFT_1213976 [Fomes fomentarius]
MSSSQKPPPGPHTSPVRPNKYKNHDPQRETDTHHRRKAQEARLEMVKELKDNVIWVPTEDFQDNLLPKPPRSVMLTDEEVETLSEKFAAMLSGYAERAHNKKAQPEVQFVDEFADVVNDYLFKIAKGKTVIPDATTPPSSKVPFSPRLLGVVPGYVMHPSPHTPGKGDDGLNKPDAGLFHDDVSLVKGSPNWALQRAFWEFKRTRGGHKFDPFVDAPEQATEAWTINGAATRGQNASYAETAFTFQHRSAVYSFSVQDSELRMLRWDRSGVFVTQSVDYVNQTGTFVELMLGFIILDDASQGIDTSASLLDKTSDEYQLMDRLASEDQEVLKMMVLPFAEDTVVSPDILPKTADNASTYPDISMGDEMPSSPHAPSLAPTSADDVTPPDAPAETGDEPSVINPKDGAFVFQHVLDAFKASLEKEFPRYRISIGKDTFLVARPIFQSTGIIGRGTRGYVAWHEQSGTFKFLKDAWRPDYVGVQAEGDILQSLNDAGVRNIPTVFYHTSVAGEMTRASHYQVKVDCRSNDERRKAAFPPPAPDESETSKDSKAQKKRKRDDPKVEDKPKESMLLRHMRHHRLVTDQVCLPLRAFRTSKQLVQVVGDCIEAHADAYEKCRLIHRDISSGNILILPVLVRTPGTEELRVVWVGILSDWELSKPMAESLDKERARQPERTGTLRYMSFALLRNKYHIVGIPDEIESFFNVVFYNALHYLPHNQQRQVLIWIKSYFDDHNDYNDGERAGGKGRYTMFRCGQLADCGWPLVFGGEPSMPLNFILGQMVLWFHSRYKIAEYEANKEPTDNDSAPSRQRRRMDGKDGSGGEQREEKGIAREHDSKGKGHAGHTAFDDLRTTLLEPTERDLQRSGYLANHDLVQHLFRSQRSEKWPQNEKWEDHVANCHSLVPKPPVLVTVTSTDAGTTPSMRIDAVPENMTADTASTESGAGPVFALNNDHALPPKIGGRRNLTADSKIQLSYESKATKSRGG